jgi:AraC-like DNA-binding protein
MASKTTTIFPGMNFGFRYQLDEHPDNKEFQLHNHPDIYEIVLFMNGDCEFCVEGNTYKLKPFDIVMTRPFEMHHIVCLTDQPYERMIVFVNEAYFTAKGCGQFLDIFQNRRLGTGNLIPAETVKTNILDCLNRMNHYVEQKAWIVADSTVIEFLYLLNNAQNAGDGFYTKDKRIRDIIMYINSHLTERLALEDLSQRFYIDKFYLCKTFKKNTGYTINQYINYKRILLVQELHKKGQSLLQASSNAGFNDYSHFYKMYLKQTGKSPKQMDQ